MKLNVDNFHNLPFELDTQFQYTGEIELTDDYIIIHKDKLNDNELISAALLENYNGYNSGFDAGYDEGSWDGYDEGYEEGINSKENGEV